MNTTQRTVLLALVFALIASTLLAVDTDAKRKRKHKHRENRASIVRVEPNASFQRLDPNVQLPELNPDILTPAEPDPCNAAEAALNGFLPQAVTLKKTDNYWARLTVNQGVSVLACDLSSGAFEVRLNNIKLEQFGKASAGGVTVGGWNKIAPNVYGQIRVSFTIGFTPPNTVTLSNLTVLAVSIDNFPNSLEGLVEQGLDAIFPSSITITI